MVSSLSLLVSFWEHSFWILNSASYMLLHFGAVHKHRSLRNAHKIASGSIHVHRDMFTYRVECGLEIVLCINSVDIWCLSEIIWSLVGHLPLRSVSLFNFSHLALHFNTVPTWFLWNPGKLWSIKHDVGRSTKLVLKYLCFKKYADEQWAKSSMRSCGTRFLQSKFPS